MTTLDLILSGGAIVAAVALLLAASTRPPKPRRAETAPPPRHTRDLFGRVGATATDGLGLDSIPDGVLRRDFDWPTDAEIEDAEWECCWQSLDRLLAKEAHEGNLRLAAAGIPLEVIVEHSIAEMQRHERALAVAEELTGELVTVGAS